MVNTRKGTYTDKSTEEILEAPSPRAIVHGIRVLSGNAMKDDETAPAVSEAHLFDMDSDDLDDVPPARLVKKVTAPDVVPEKFADHSPISNIAAPSDPHAVPPVASSVPKGGTEAQSEETPLDNVDSVEPVAPGDHNDEVPVTDTVDPSAQQETPSVSTVPIDGISFHLEENVQRWKFFVQRRIAYEVNISDKHHSCVSIMNLIEKAGLSKTISDEGPFYPQLIREFIINFPADFNDPSSPDYQTVHVRGFKFTIFPTVINGTLSSWPVNGIPAVALSVKYAILHKIGIANWFPSSHASSVSVALGTFFYHICNDNRVDAGAFIYNQLLSHLGSFWVKLPIALPSHVPDIDHDVHPSRGPRVFDTMDWDEAIDGFFVDKKLASRILNSLTIESRSLATAISLMSGRRLEIDSLIRHLKTFAPFSSRGKPSTD
ncbi:uncharacterized protein LOC127148689 [Cucumis melo]|uniref:Uncharacterized protein LOC127148689 n=1 Tax=Cucumis melo TaxID=3656 RepID=A0ABM3KM17_CUCME|nr:uncharacterized protein LOC127148689 [Cucumis melo]